MTNTIIAVVGDLQIGSTTGLAPLNYELHTRNPKETQTVPANILQRWIYNNWIDYWAYVKSLAKQSKSRVVVFCLGETLEGNHHDSNQVVPAEEDQRKMAIDLLEPVINLCSGQMYATKGTDAHAGKAGKNEDSLYQELGIVHDWRLRLNVDGILHDIAHHGRVGGRPWTSQAASVVTEVISDCAMHGDPVPSYIWRAHNHKIDDSGEKIKGTRYIALPSWQLKTSFGHRVASAQLRSDIGGVVFDGKHVDFSHARYMAEPDVNEVITV